LTRDAVSCSRFLPTFWRNFVHLDSSRLTAVPSQNMVCLFCVCVTQRVG
jgi:hypothetical protein